MGALSRRSETLLGINPYRLATAFTVAPGLVAQIASSGDSWRESSVIAGVYESICPPIYRTKNWPEYNRALKQRGSLTI